MEQILIFLTIIVVGVFVSVKSFHQKLNKLPWVGFLSFTALNILLIFRWGGIWQLWSIHLTISILMLEYLFISLNHKKAFRVMIKFNRKLFLLCAYVSLCGLILFPVVTKVNHPNSDKPVGTWKMIVESTEREETLAQTNGLKRRFTVQLYYPIQNKSGKQKKWFDGGNPSIKGLALSYGFPQMLVSHLKKVDSGAYLSRKIKLKDSPYQVVVISHGLKGSSDQYTQLAESLVEKGYFVAVINHAYSSYATVFNQNDYILGAKSLAAQIDFIEQKIELEKQITLIQQGDLMETFKVLDQINQGNYDPIFKAQLDLSDMTLVGHQIGGGAVLVTLNQVPYVKTGILLNPIIEQIPKKYILEGSIKPVISLVSKDYVSSNNATYLKRYMQGSKDALWIEAKLGKDLDMTDLNKVSTFFAFNGISDGKKSSDRLIEAQVAIVDQAIQKYSLGQIFEDIPQNLDSAHLGISILKPEAIDGK